MLQSALAALGVGGGRGERENLLPLTTGQEPRLVRARSARGVGAGGGSKLRVLLVLVVVLQLVFT